MSEKISYSGKITLMKTFIHSDITDKYIRWLNDKEVVKYSNQRFQEHTKETSLSYLKNFKNSQNNFFSIKSIDSKENIGTITTYINVNHSTADIGILIGDKSTWGKGFGLDAWKATMDWLTNEKKIRKITAGTLSINYGMINIIKKSGMKHDGARLRQELCDGKYRDMMYFATFND